MSDWAPMSRKNDRNERDFHIKKEENREEWRKI
jgi:hypothetical protein